MQHLAGTTLDIPVSIVVAGTHTDPDTGTLTGAIVGHAEAALSVEKIGTGNYILHFTGISPATVEGDQLAVLVDGEIGAVAWSQWMIVVDIIATEYSGASTSEPGGDLQVDAARANPMRIRVGTEDVWEYPLDHQVEAEKYVRSQQADSAPNKTVGDPMSRMGIFRFQLEHRRP